MSFPVSEEYLTTLKTKINWAREYFPKNFLDSTTWKMDENGFIISKKPKVIRMDEPTTLPRLRVLSLFDGIGTGFYSLTESGFNIETYFASEVDSDALLLTQHHFNNKLIQLGSIAEINEGVLNKIGPIDLLIGGSPCEELSCINYRRKGIYDPTGTGILFFDYYRIWQYLKQISIQENRPFYWLYENVANMEKITRDTISKFLHGEPYILDSVFLSPQNRKRLFWSNLPDMQTLEDILVEDEENDTELDDYLDKNLNRKANFKKIGTITTKRNCLNDSSSKDPVDQDGELMGLYITEIEDIFGFPVHYTDVGNLSITKRQKLLGKAWSVQVVKKIFGLLKGTYATTQ